MLDQSELKSKLRAISEANAAHHVLDILESNLRRMGATHILITGLPMPNRPIDNLVQRFRWPDQRNDGIESTSLSANDSALMAICKSRGHPNVELVYAIPGYQGPFDRLPPSKELREAQLQRILWTPKS